MIHSTPNFAQIRNLSIAESKRGQFQLGLVLGGSWGGKRAGSVHPQLRLSSIDVSADANPIKTLKLTFIGVNFPLQIGQLKIAKR